MNPITGKGKGKQLEGCGHMFHKACIHSFYKNGGRTCPNCRHPAKNMAPTAPVSNAEQKRLQALFEEQRTAHENELQRIESENRESRRRQQLIAMIEGSFARDRQNHPLW